MGDAFVPFHKFLEDVQSNAHKQGEASGPGPVAAQSTAPASTTGAERERMQNYLASQYRDAEVVHSYMGDDGQYVDCIKTGTQPGLRGQTMPATPPDLVAMPGTTRGDVAQATRPRVDRFGNVMVCPPGAIPVRRVTLDQLSHAGTLENYFQKAPGGGALPPQPGSS